MAMSPDATHARELASFVVGASFEDLSEEALRELKIRVLDSLGCAIGAVDGEPVRMLREQTREFGGEGLCTLVGGGRTAPDRAAFYNGALVRYLDFNDSYLAPGETCHPSDNLGAVLAAAEHEGVDGRELLTALAVAYQVHCRLSDEAPVRDRGFDHATQGVVAAAAGVSRALGLDPEATANALAIAGTAYNALRVTRTGALSHWKGLAMPDAARSAVHAAYLARRGITGPPEVFEGNKGWRWTVSGEWELDWSAEDLERVTATDIKKYNAEIHSQSAVEGALELMDEHGLEPEDVDRVELDVFQVAYDIIGGGEEGEKTTVRTKEEADHSLPYIVAVAILDGGVYPEQYRPERIAADDVQRLLRRVQVRPDDGYSARFPGEHACRVTLVTSDGREVSKEKTSYEGFHSDPMSWATVEAKARRLAAGHADDGLMDEIVELCRGLEDAAVGDLTDALARVEVPGG
jgi:2-methylcitrate dehydratase